MDGLEFVSVTPAAPADPARADIACFIGWVGRRVPKPVTSLTNAPPAPDHSNSGLAGERARLISCLRLLRWSGPELKKSATLLPADVLPDGASQNSFASWLREKGWKPEGRPEATRDNELFKATLRLWFNDAIANWLSARGLLDPAAGYTACELLELLDAPVPIESWNDFDALFAWDLRPIELPTDPKTPINVRYADTFLGAAVRSFFRQGGRKCFVVRLGEPAPVFSPRAARCALAARFNLDLQLSPVDRRTWRGIGHLFGLPEVSYLCLPDLPDLFAEDSQRLPVQYAPASEEKFIECAERTEPPTVHPLRDISPPRCSAEGFGDWASFVCRVGELLNGPPTQVRPLREVQFLAALPLPVNERMLSGTAAYYGLEFEKRWQKFRTLAKRAVDAQWDSAATIQTAFIQLAYPWLRTRDSGTLPGDLEPPDAALAGMIANLALTRGAWRSIARENVPWLQSVEPVLTRADLDRLIPRDRKLPRRTVRERISVFGPTGGGFRLLSDVMTDDDPGWRPASVNRLMNLILRAARQAGEEFVFANNGEQLWSRVRRALTDVLTALWADGAFEGASAEDAFDVRCDRSTMTQADLDAGRVIVRLHFTAAVPIEHIVVVLAMGDAGQVSLLSAERADARKEAA